MEKIQEKKKTSNGVNTARVNTDTKRIDDLKELYRSVPMQLDFQRVRIMKEVYEENVGYQQIIKRSKFLAAVLDRKDIYIDDNLFVGSMAGSLNWHLHPSGVERRVDAFREYRGELTDRGRPRGQRMGAQLLGHPFAEDPFGGDLREEVRIQSTPRCRFDAYLLVP